MKVSKHYVESVVRTLPIGYYIGRNVPVQIVEGAEMSSYNPKDDCIEISLDQVLTGFDKVAEGDYTTAETLIRSNYYHEVSHAFLTPSEMRVNDIVNIFEDERIERLLDDYYYGVDFEKSLNAINDRTVIPENAIQAFFALVRFHIGKPELVARVNEIINTHRQLHRNSGTSSIVKYVNDIESLFKDLCEDMGENVEEYMKMLAHADGGEGEEKAPIESKVGDRVVKGIKGLSATEVLARTEQEFRAKVPVDTKLVDTLSRLFENYKKKNSGGSSLQAYSGVLNPRLASRTDYRIFERVSSVRGNNSFGNFHLNLFIDISGSFSSNQETTNQIIRALQVIEEKNPMFSFDVITINFEVKLKDRKNRYIRCTGGNHMDKDIFDIFRKQQFPMTCNYNIVMFDGDAYSNDASRTHKWVPNGYGFLAFAQNNCTIVTDPDNKRYINQYCPTTRTIYTHNYNDELVDNIISVLYQALS